MTNENTVGGTVTLTPSPSLPPGPNPNQPIGTPGNAQLMRSQIEARICNPEREAELLYALLYMPDELLRILDEFNADFFSVEEFASIFETVQEMHLAGRTINAHAVSDHLKRHVKPTEVDDFQHALDVIANATPVDTVDNIIISLQEIYRSRLFHQEIIVKASQQFRVNEPLEKVMRTVSDTFQKMELGKRHKRSTSDIVADTISKVLNPPPGGIGKRIGLDLMDQQFGGFKPDTLITIGALSGQGKTGAIIDFIERLSYFHADSVAVLFFSFEMSEERIVRRLLSRKAKISNQRLMGDGLPLNHSEKNDLADAALLIKDYPLEMVYQSMDTHQMKMKVKNFVLSNPDKQIVVVVDHIAKVNTKTEDLRMKTIQVMEMCKSFCIDYKATTIVLSQLKKELESDDSNFHRPNLSHLMESGSVKSESDIVMLGWRPEVWHPTINFRGNPQWDTKDKMIFLVEKNRDGHAPNDIILKCEIKYNYLDNYVEDYL